MVRGFDYMKLKESSWDTEVLSFVAQIREYKGRQELYLRQKPVELERLVKAAKIQSTDSSNRIEGIGTSNARMKQLVQERSTPRNRDEQEIVGYRDVLNTIYESYEHIPLKGSVILQLHRDLLSYTDKTFGGKFKNTQNYLNETHAMERPSPDSPPEPFQTPEAVEAICNYQALARHGESADPNPLLILRFLCIHPFNDLATEG